MKTTAISPQLFKVLEPLIHISRITGFLPVTFEKKGSKYHLEESLKLKVYSYIFVTTLTVLTIWGLHQDSHQDSIRMRNPVIKYIVMVDLGEIAVTVFVGVVTTPFKMKYFWKILQGFSKSEKVLAGSFLGEGKKFVVTMGVTMISVMAVLICDMILWGVNSPKVGVFGQRFAAYYVCYVLVFIQEAPFCFFARLIRKNIEFLNGGLQNGLDDIQKSYGGNQWVSVTKITTEVKTDKELSYDRLNDFMKLVETTDDVIEAVNDFCGVHTLFILMSCILHLVITPYFLLVEVCNSGYLFFILLQIFWVLVHVGRLMVIVETCQNCVDEYQKTTNLVLKLLTLPLTLEVKEQVEILTVQISNKKVKFTSFGMMKISRSILTAFGSSVTTFLVILFQYGGANGNVYVQK